LTDAGGQTHLDWCQAFDDPREKSEKSGSDSNCHNTKLG